MKTTTEKMTATQLLDIYYNGLANKSGWETVIADDFKFVGGDMTNQEPTVGKDAYITVIDRFSKLFTTMRVKSMLTSDNKAFVRASYDYQFPNGTKLTGDVAEVWEIKDGELSGLTIFFDTLSFQRLLSPTK
jgi:ketosteroid isomerase-like protein